MWFKALEFIFLLFLTIEKKKFRGNLTKIFGQNFNTLFFYSNLFLHFLQVCRTIYYIVFTRIWDSQLVLTVLETTFESKAWQ